MESMSPECTSLKTSYDVCFQNWYTTKFLKQADEGIRGTSAGMDECDELFKKYKSCVMKAVKERGIEDLLIDARKETPFKTFGKEKR